MRRLTIIILLLAGLAVASGHLPWPRPLIASRSGPAMTVAGVKSWGLQLQNVLPLAIPSSVDVMVVDVSHGLAGGEGWTRAAVEALRQRDGGKPRTVLAYLSIGEAEAYRHYWRDAWRAHPPAWLGPENPNWKGNYAVRYWAPEWQQLIVAAEPTVRSRLLEWLAPQRKPFIDRIIDAGFDGVYLDRVDAFDDWENERGEDRARADMAAFIGRIASYARSRRPGFLVVPQNGEELLELPGYVDLVDGVAKEDLLYGATSEGTANDENSVSDSIALLNRAKAKGKPVLVVEYLSADDPRRLATTRAIAAHGYVPLVAERALDHPPELPPTVTEPAQTVQPRRPTTGLP